MWRVIVIGVLMLAYCLPAAYVTLWPDTVRDLAASLALARGEAIPLVGPGPINFGPYAGPAWIWLQAPPLVFFHSFAVTSLYVALIASLKFPALYSLGNRLSGPRLGLCAAAAAAFPSFAIYQWIMFFHPNWVEASVAATLILFLVADRKRSLRWTYAAVAMLGLAVQIHTSTLFYFPLAAVVLYRIGLRGPRIALHLIAMAALIVLWFAPVAFAPPPERGTLEGAGQRIAADMSHFGLQPLETSLRTAYVSLPLAVGDTYGTAGHVPPWLWQAGLGWIGIVVLAGGLIRLRARESRAWFAALMLLLAAWIAAVAVRSYTSFYLVYFLLPLSALVLGLCIEGAMSAPWGALRAAGVVAVAFLVIFLVAAAYGARAVGRSGIIDSAVLSMGDMQHPVEQRVRGAYVSVVARDALAKEVCALPDAAITLHGELAYALLTSLGLDYRMHCPASEDRYVVFGAARGAHLAMLPESVARGFGIAQGRDVAGFRLLASIRALHPADGRKFEKRFNYVERISDRRPMERVAIELDTNAGEIVAVYRFKPYATAWNDFRVTKDGAIARAAFTTFDSWVYASAAGHWKIEVETDAPQWVEVFAIPR
jgi:4-amino-4-deoxy-L-arabinose transferase-like glycosyltransferase